VCHGYGELADEFLNRLTPLHRSDILVVAPEGMHNFYKKGFSGDIGATWMTKRNRESEIEDYSSFLQILFDNYTLQVPPDSLIVLLGFSQGGATIFRWIMRNQPHFHKLMLWGSLPPEDLNYSAQSEYLSTKELFLLYGTADPFLTEDHISIVKRIEEVHSVDFQEFPFDGGHEIPLELLAQYIIQDN
jgi:predicted esterase